MFGRFDLRQPIAVNISQKLTASRLPRTRSCCGLSVWPGLLGGWSNGASLHLGPMLQRCVNVFVGVCVCVGVAAVTVDSVCTGRRHIGALRTSASPVT